jgi:hypothetical protein
MAEQNSTKEWRRKISRICLVFFLGFGCKRAGLVWADVSRRGDGQDAEEPELIAVTLALTEASAILVLSCSSK